MFKEAPAGKTTTWGKRGRKKDFCPHLSQTFLTVNSECAEAEMESVDRMNIEWGLEVRRPPKPLPILGFMILYICVHNCEEWTEF